MNPRNAPSAHGSLEPEPSSTAVAPPGDPEAQESFRIDCPTAKPIPVQSGDAFPCAVTSVGGFTGPVALRCANVPAGLDCRPDPKTVNLPAAGSVQFHLGLSNNSVEAGSHSFQVVGTSGGTSARFTFPFDLGSGYSVEDAAGSSAFVDCRPFPPNSMVALGQSASTECVFAASPLFHGTVSASCEAPPGITCSVAPGSVAPRESQPARVTLTVSVAPDAPVGRSTVYVNGQSDAFDGKLRPPSNFVDFLVIDPAPPVVKHVGPAYTVGCSFADGELRIAAGGSGALMCMVESLALDGEVALVVDGQGPAAPHVIPGPATVRLRPGQHMSLGAVFNAGDAAPGVYEFVLTIRPVGNGDYSPDHPSQRQTLKVVVEAPPG